MADSDCESNNTDDLLSGIHPLDSISPLTSPMPMKEGPKIVVTPPKEFNEKETEAERTKTGKLNHYPI